MNRAIRPTLCLVFLIAMATSTRAQWTAPTDEELKMTSQPEVPGAAAVYLFKEETTDDKLHTWSKYIRLKVLTEKGMQYANVELRQYQHVDAGGYTVSDIQGRTIHPDGTIIPFTGKPYEKVIEKAQGVKESAKVFTLPDVTVGSIIEYRYNLRYDDNYFYAPNWDVQSDLYTRKAHYQWKPTEEQLITKNDRGEQLTSVVSWTPILPKGFEVKQSHRVFAGSSGAFIELDVHDIAPVPEEEHTPPMQSLSYRVLFYYSAYHSEAEYWKNEGKGWSKALDKFIGPDAKMKEVAASLVSPGDSNDQKLRKFYAAVMQLENTRFTRDRSATENKSRGLKEVNSVDDVWDRKRGTDDQMAELFVALARASGMKAYVMAVADLDRRLFLRSFLSFSQLDDLIAIVNVDGKEKFFDPGQRYCPYGHLVWKHTLTQGIRQIENGTALAQMSAEPLTFSRTQRTAVLNMDEHGEASGTVRIAWSGNDALRWRQAYLMGDTTSLHHGLQSTLEHNLPSGMEVHVSKIDNLEDYERPLIVNYNVKGQIGSSTGKRVFLPSDIFEVNSKPTFTHEKREQPIFFNYERVIQDVTRFNFPTSLGIESSPSNEQIPLTNVAVYAMETESASTSVTVHREFDLVQTIYKQEEYPELRTFFNKFETKDQEPIVLKSTPQTVNSN